MALIKEEVLVEPIHRTPADREADRETTIKNLKAEAWKEWPNAAGFTGLTEHRGPIELPVTGDIPTWAAGSLYRTGPGGSGVENTPRGTFNFTHWFDGFGHTHRFDIVVDEPTAAVPVEGDAAEANGSSSTSSTSSSTSSPPKVRVYYSSRRQSDRMVANIKATGRRNFYSFSQKRDPCVGLFGKIMSVFEKRSKNAAEENINVAVHANLPGIPSNKPARDPSCPPSASGGHRTTTAGVKNVWVTTDNCSLLELDVATLEPVGSAKQFMLHPDLKGPFSCAHAQRDPLTGDLFNFNLEPGRFATYRIFRVSSETGKTEILATITGPTVKAAYLHSFFLTPSYVVLCLPVSHYAYGGLKMMWEKNVLDSIEPFDKSKEVSWFVVDRKEGKGVVARFDTPAAFFFHSVNAFEEETADGKSMDVYCDLLEYANMDIAYGFYYDVVLDRNGAMAKHWAPVNRLSDCMETLVRYRFRVPKVTKGEELVTDVTPAGERKAAATGTGKEGAAKGTAESKPQPEKMLAIPAPHCGEVPTINPAYACRKQRFVYGMADFGLSTLLDAIVKTDMETGEALIWRGPRGHTPGEAIFVARPPSEGEENPPAEDDGVLLSVILDGTNERSYLLVLDARTMREVGRADCEFAVALGFHGAHIQ